MPDLDRPIFLVGHARGGSTLLAAIINWHSHVGPVHDMQRKCNSVNEFLDQVYSPNQHFEYAQFVENKSLWFEYFGGENVFTHMGMELLTEKVTWGEDKICEFKQRLISSFTEQRFLSKAPTNSFRIKAIRQLFPSAKIVAIYRCGESVISSWGQRQYGFGSRVNWGEVKSRKLGYIRGINVFKKKWFETIDYIESVKQECDVYTISYEQLVTNPTATVEELFEFLQLPVENYINFICLKGDPMKWKMSIPSYLHLMTKFITREGNRLIANSTEPGGQ